MSTATDWMLAGHLAATMSRADVPRHASIVIAGFRCQMSAAQEAGDEQSAETHDSGRGQSGRCPPAGALGY